MTEEALKELHKFFERSLSIPLKKHEIIMRPDQTPGGIFYVKKGNIKVYSITENGEEKLHIIYGPGDFFPLIWLFHNIQKNVYYEAMNSALLKRAKKDEFMRFLKLNPEVLFHLAAHLAKVVNVFVDRVESLETTNAYPRFVSGLLTLTERFGVKKYGRIIIEAPLTHKDIANSVNMTRETASREFEKLEKKNLVGYKNRKIVIKDLRKLEKELSRHYERTPI